MIPTTANFDTYRNATSQDPVVVLAMPTLGLTYTNRADQPGLSGASTFTQLPAGLSQSVSDLQGSATVGALSLTIVDVNRSVLALLATKQFYGAPASLQLGFVGMAYPTDYITIFSGQIETMVPTTDHTAWTISIKDKNRALSNNAYGTGDDGTSPTSKKNPRTLDGNPLDLVTDLLQNELGMAAVDIDTTAIAALKAGRFSCTRMLFSLTKAVNAKTFLENELMRPNGLFHFARYNGAISVADICAPPEPVTLAVAFTQSNIKGLPTFRQQAIYNWVQFDLDYDGSNYLDTEEFIDSPSVNKFNLQAVLQIQSQGMRTNLQGASRAGITARRIFQRYAGGPANQVSLVAAGLSSCIVEVGDYVTVSHPLLENLNAGTLGWTNHVCQVLRTQPDWAHATISYDLIDVTSQIRAAYQYAPDSVPAWTSATTAQKQQYMFEANSSSEQSDGTSAAGVF